MKGPHAADDSHRTTLYKDATQVQSQHWVEEKTKDPVGLGRGTAIRQAGKMVAPGAWPCHPTNGTENDHPLRVNCLVPEDYFHGEAILYDEHKSKSLDTTRRKCRLFNQISLLLTLKRLSRRKITCVTSQSTWAVMKNDSIVYLMI